MRKLIIPVFIPELGCPGRCVFCDQRRISGQQEAPVPETITALINNHLATNPCPGKAEVEVAFFGGTFTALSYTQQEKYLQQVQPFIERGMVQKIRVSTRPDRITAENVLMLREYGVWLIELGIQSLDDKVLGAVQRGYQRWQVEQAVKIIHQWGLRFGAQLMPGLPASSAASDRESALLCAQWGAATARIYPTLVLAGTELEQMYQQGIYQPLDLETAVEICTDMCSCFAVNNIPVIRVGLQTSSDLEKPGVVVAGPWHPALGEMVKSRAWRRQLSKALVEIDYYQPIIFEVPAHQLSQVIGQHRTNISWLQAQHGADVSIEGSLLLPDSNFNVKYCD